MFKSVQKEHKQTLRQYLRNVSLLNKGKSADSLYKGIEENSNPLKSIQNTALQIVEVCGLISALNLQKLHQNSFLIEFSDQIQKFCDKMRDSWEAKKPKQKDSRIPSLLVTYPPRETQKSKLSRENTSKVIENQISDPHRFTRLQQSLTSNKITETPEIKQSYYNPQEKAIEPTKRVDSLFGSRTIPSYYIINVDGFSGKNRKKKRRTGDVFQNFG